MPAPWTVGPAGGDPVAVGLSLLGCLVVSDLPGADGVPARVVVRLTEVEAYGSDDDPGSHAFRGPTRRNRTMFAGPGRLYVYLSYGMHWCANITCAESGSAGAVLLRAGVVVEGLDVARGRRSACRRDVDLARGPARLAAALGITGADDGLDLRAADSPVRVEAAPAPPGSSHVRRGPRVGVGGPGGDGDAYPWRLWLDGEPSVSSYRPGRARA